MRITSKGQVTIPQGIREKYGLLPDTDIDFKITEDGRVYLERNVAKTSRGEELVRSMRGMFKGSGLSTEELMALTRGGEWEKR